MRGVERRVREALRLVDEERDADYGDPKVLWGMVAKGWEVIFADGVDYNKCMFAMMWLKMCRELVKHKEDNGVDTLAYLLMKLRSDDEQQAFQGDLVP